MENSPSAANPETEEPHYRTIAPEANQLHGKKPSAERIGQVLVAADMETPAEPEKNLPTRAATMSRDELLDMSQEITVDNTNLRHIYDSHLIGENGLRRLVNEHIHGGDIKEVLHDEILEHQTDFERDPRLRHQLAMRDNHKPAAISLKDLLKKAGIVDTETNDSQQNIRTKQAGYNDHMKDQLRQQAYQRKLLDFVFIGIILILLALVILLALKRG
jgi:hypothetical protein